MSGARCRPGISEPFRVHSRSPRGSEPLVRPLGGAAAQRPARRGHGRPHDAVRGPGGRRRRALLRGLLVLVARPGLRRGALRRPHRPLHADAPLHVAPAALQAPLRARQPDHPLGALAVPGADPRDLLRPPHGHAPRRGEPPRRPQLDHALPPGPAGRLAPVLRTLHDRGGARPVPLLLPPRQAQAPAPRRAGGGDLLDVDGRVALREPGGDLRGLPAAAPRHAHHDDGRQLGPARLPLPGAAGESIARQHHLRGHPLQPALLQRRLPRRAPRRAPLPLDRAPGPVRDEHRRVRQERRRGPRGSGLLPGLAAPHDRELGAPVPGLRAPPRRTGADRRRGGWRSSGAASFRSQGAAARAPVTAPAA